LNIKCQPDHVKLDDKNCRLFQQAQEKGSCCPNSEFNSYAIHIYILSGTNIFSSSMTQLLGWFIEYFFYIIGEDPASSPQVRNGPSDINIYMNKYICFSRCKRIKHLIWKNIYTQFLQSILNGITCMKGNDYMYESSPFKKNGGPYQQVLGM